MAGCHAHACVGMLIPAKRDMATPGAMATLASPCMLTASVGMTPARHFSEETNDDHGWEREMYIAQGHPEGVCTS